MRKQLLSVFLPMLLLGLVASAAEMPASQPASQHNELQRVNVVRGADEIRVVISARGAVAPKLSTADSPARLVVDLPGTVMATGQTHIAVGSAGVKGVRIGMDGQTPPTTRVVVDLEHALRYELTPLTDGKLVLTLHTQPVAAAAGASAPQTVAASLPAQTKIMSPFAPRVMEAPAPRVQPVAASAPVAPKAATESVLPAMTQKSEKAASSSSDFVFVEPTFQAKKTVADASTT
ncbi:MAG: AMIN domain-containing protein, partial [Candidatus Sulfotelmatobacter sp.]